MTAAVLIEDLPTQLILPMWTHHELDAFLDIQQRKLLKKVNRKTPTRWTRPKPARTRMLDQFSDDLLDCPLGPNVDDELHGLGDPFSNDGKELLEEESDEEVSWSDEAVEQLHERILLYSLRCLNASGNGKEKKLLLRWIFDPEALAVGKAETPESPIVWKVIDPRYVPFSFEYCCLCAGYSAERLREGLGPVLKELGLEALLKEVEDARDTEQSIRAAKAQHALDF